MANLEYYESQLEGIDSTAEIKSIVDEAYQDEDLSEQDIKYIKEYAQEIYDEHVSEYIDEDDELTDDELGLTQM